MYAQTNVQLFDQLRREGYTEADLRLIREAYDLSRRLYAGYFIASGRTQIAHLVGTASILGSLHVPAEVVAGGLIHNVYETGDFGDGREGSSERRRHQIRQAIGAGIEQYAYRFPIVKRDVGPLATGPHRPPVSTVFDEPGALELVDRHVLLIVVAERLDHRRNLESLNEYLNGVDRVKGEIAERLGCPGIAAELKAACEEAALESWAAVSQQGRCRSEVIAPRSYRKRLWLVVRPKVGRALRRLSSVLHAEKGLDLLLDRVSRGRSTPKVGEI
jgi:(p)ppGpp synthase/HD superfamily hydrolase